MKKPAVKTRPMVSRSIARSGYKDSETGLYKGIPISPCNTHNASLNPEHKPETYLRLTFATLTFLPDYRLFRDPIALFRQP